MGLCVFDVYEKYYNSKTGGMSNIMGKNPYPLSPQGVNSFVDIFRGSSYMRIQFLPDGSLFVLVITNKVVINK